MKVLVVGFFDILHSGHLLMLQTAKHYGDYLVVGIGSEKRAKDKKGDDRPILSEAERSFVISHIDCVDEVICAPDGSGLTPAEHDEMFIKQTNPDIFIRSKVDKEIKKVCERYDLTLVKIPELTGIDGMHSSDIIKKIKSN